MQTRPAGVGEHVQHVKLGFVLIFSNLIGLLFHPPLLPFLLNLSKIVFHCLLSFLNFNCKGTIK